MRQVPRTFDARFSALRRHYRYRVCDAPWGVDPLRRHDTLGYHRRLDGAAMNAASALLLGEHNFAAFCRRREGASTIREPLDLRWARAEPGVLAGRVVADAFCNSMVRALTGALLKVGDGSRPPGWPAQVLRAGVRDPAVPTHGDQPARQELIVDVALEVAVEHLQAGDVEADVNGIDLGLQGPHEPIMHAPDRRRRAAPSMMGGRNHQLPASAGESHR